MTCARLTLGIAMSEKVAVSESVKGDDESTLLGVTVFKPSLIGVCPCVPSAVGIVAFELAVVLRELSIESSKYSPLLVATEQAESSEEILLDFVAGSIILIDGASEEKDTCLLFRSSCSPITCVGSGSVDNGELLRLLEVAESGAGSKKKKRSPFVLQLMGTISSEFSGTSEAGGIKVPACGVAFVVLARLEVIQLKSSKRTVRNKSQ